MVCVSPTLDLVSEVLHGAVKLMCVGVGLCQRHMNSRLLLPLNTCTLARLQLSHKSYNNQKSKLQYSYNK